MKFHHKPSTMKVVSIFFCLYISKVSGVQFDWRPVDPCARTTDCIVGFRMPSPTNCSRYYICEAGWTSQTCGPGYLFDMSRLECNPIGKAVCHPPCPVITTTVPTPTEPAVVVFKHELATGSTPVIGRPLVVTCQVELERTTSRFSIVWTLDGEVLESGSRVGINEIRMPFTDRYISALSYEQLTGLDSGTLSCDIVQTRRVISTKTLDLGDVIVEGYGNNEESCPGEETRGVRWLSTPSGSTATMPCPTNTIGFATRYCSGTIWGRPDLTLCITPNFAKLSFQTDTEYDTTEAASSAASKLVQLTQEEEMVVGNLNLAVQVLDGLSSNFENHQQWDVQEEDLDNMVLIASNILSADYIDPWIDLLQVGLANATDPANPANPIPTDASTDNTFHTNRAVSLMESMDRVGHVASRILLPGETQLFGGRNVEMQAKSFTPDAVTSVQFPDPDAASETWFGSRMDHLELPVDALRHLVDDNGDVIVTSTRYETLGSLLTDTSKELNSHVVSMSIESSKTVESKQELAAPVQLFLRTQRSLNATTEVAECVFWDFGQNDRSGGWSSEGCRVAEQNDSFTHCECDHLTNFAVLVSHAPASGVHHTILGIITMVGCIVSIICLLITLLIFFILWRQIKSQSTLVMVNLCVALILGNFFFLIGIDGTGSPTYCQVMAVLIHYFYLAGFALMACQGILLFLYLVIVFHIKGKHENLIIVLSAWGVPAIIVGLTMGITRMEGYGREDFCWLTIKNGALWAFLGPVIGVILMNIVILVISIKSITKPTKARKQTQKDYVKSTVWNMVVLLPILGVTWLFGALAISSGTLVFQYLFSIFNSFQGLFIFLFHCFFNRRIREALNDKLVRSHYTPNLLKPLLNVKSTTSTNSHTRRSSNARTQQVTMATSSRPSSSPSYTATSTRGSPERQTNGGVSHV